MGEYILRLVALIPVVLHLVAGRFGWLERYEVYLNVWIALMACRIYRDQLVYAGAFARVFVDTFVRDHTFDATVDVDGVVHELSDLTDLIVKNTRIYAGAWIPDRTSRADDGLVEIVPMFLIKKNVPTISAVKPYTALEVLGRDLYIREGCVGCHSQMIRPFRSETERYGEYAKSGEYVFEHPFLWGSKRTGPDLLRVGGKYPDAWHYNHMEDPRSTSPGSIMPPYPWLLSQTIDTNSLPARISALRKIGVPYEPGFENGAAQQQLAAQAKRIVGNLQVGGVTNVPPDREIVALIAYLQRLGSDIKAATPPTADASEPAPAQVANAAKP
mgnify:CR=1 FL=1